MTIYKNQVWLPKALASCITIVLLTKGATCAQLSVGLSSDLSRPTYGLYQPTSSQVTMDDRNGINVQGALQDLLGPPIKMARGFNNMVNGSNMAGIGQGLKSGHALIRLDTKLLEAAGGAHLLEGGLLMGGAAAKIGKAKTIPGKKIASIVELPVKVIAMKHLAEGKALTELARAKSAEAEQSEARGDKMIQQGKTLKSQGMNQVIQGATEGIQNFGQAIQQTAGNAATAMKLLPIIFDMNTPASPQQHQQQQGAEKGQHQQSEHTGGRQSAGNGPLTGGSLFGGLNSLVSGLGDIGNDPLLNTLGGNNQHRPSPFGQLFGGGSGGQQNHYAVLNAANPLTNLLLNPNTNPFLLPINGALDPMSNPIANSLSQVFNPTRHSTQAGGSGAAGNGFGFVFGSRNNQGNGVQTSTFNLGPGLRYSETTSSGKMNPSNQQQQQQHQSQEKTSQQVAEQPSPVKTPHQQPQVDQQQQQKDGTKKI